MHPRRHGVFHESPGACSVPSLWIQRTARLNQWHGCTVARQSPSVLQQPAPCCHAACNRALTQAKDRIALLAEELVARPHLRQDSPHLRQDSPHLRQDWAGGAHARRSSGLSPGTAAAASGHGRPSAAQQIQQLLTLAHPRSAAAASEVDRSVELRPNSTPARTGGKRAAAGAAHAPARTVVGTADKWNLYC